MFFSAINVVYCSQTSIVFNVVEQCSALPPPHTKPPHTNGHVDQRSPDIVLGKDGVAKSIRVGVLAKLGKMDAHLGKETLNARRGIWAALDRST